MHETRNYIVGNMENQIILKKKIEILGRRVQIMLWPLSRPFPWVYPMDGYYNY